jgi:PAS domain S-box-containing protein
MPTLRVLLLEDSQETEARLLRIFEQGGYTLSFKRVQQAAELQTALATANWDLLLSNAQLAQLSSLQALDVLQAGNYDVPFIILSGPGYEEMAVEAMRAGAYDCLPKDNLSRLLPAVERALREAENRRQRRMAEQALEEMRLRMEGIIASAMDAIITINQQQEIVLFNKAAEQMFGYAQEMVVGRKLHFLLPHRFRENHGRFIEQFGKTGQTSRSLAPASAVFGLRKNGEEFPIEASISHAEVKQERFYTVIIRDTTAAHAATQKLKEEKQRLELALVGGGLGLWDWTLSSGRVVMSEHWAAIMGYEAGEMVETMERLVEQIHPDDQPGLAEATRRYLEHPVGYYRHEYRIRNRAGEWRWVQTSGRVFEQDAQGAPLRMVGTHQDITEQKAAAETIRNMELEMLNLKIAEQRAIASSFLNGQEEERKRLARELHDGIGQLLSALKIQLSMQAVSAEIQRSVDLIMRETVRINNNLMPLVLQDFGLEAGLRQLIEKNRELSQADMYFYCDLKGMRFSPELEIGVFRITQEATSNALKYAQAQQISVQLTLQQDELLLMIEDDGLGFDPAVKMKRLEKGFGLFNMHYRAETLQGQLQIESSPGRGCLIHVVIPILKH